MALAYDTYYALPRLENYQQALDHYNRVKPIARDPHETRPLGKRKQKWVSIWQDPTTKAISAGYGAEELSSRKPLVTYHPDGTITIPRTNRWTSASCNERLTRLLGTEVRKHQYDQWIRCNWYDAGELKYGWLPVAHNPGRSWDGVPVINHFVRDPSGRLVFLNYRYPVTHRLDKKVWNETLATFKPFISYYLNLRKIAFGELGTRGQVFDDEAIAEVYGWSDNVTFNGKRYPNRPDYITAHDPEKRESSLAEFVRLARSDDAGDRMRAMMMYEHATGSWCHDHLNQFNHYIMTAFRDDVFKVEAHTDGSLVRDKYRRMFR